MSYLVLARKYRPHTFDDLVGQPHVVRPLSNALKSGRIAHAYLFTGARGVGKTTVARLLAMALNCRADEDKSPCGECESCVEISDGQAVDVFEIDGASNRGINEIRDLRETIKYLPSKGHHKIYIIDEVHMLTKEAFNALLKTLEEPPAHVVFIFATTEAHKVLPTILSRCQRYDFKRIGLSDIVGRLREIADKEGITINDGPLRLLARESEGGMRDALSLFDQVIAFSGLTISDEDVADALGLIDQTLVSNLAKALMAGDAGTALDLLNQMFNFGYDTKDLAAQVLEYFRSLVVIKVSKNPEKILDMLDAELSDLKTAAVDVSLPTLNFHFNAWLDVQSRLARATQPRLVLEALIVRLAQVEPLQPLADLVARLESLLAGAGPLPTGGGGGTPSGQRGGGPSPGPGPGPGRIPIPPDRSPGGGGRMASPPAAETKSASTPKKAGPVAADPSKKGPPPGPKDWPGFLQFLRSNNPVSATMLERGQLKGFSPEKVEILFGDKSMMGLIDRDDILKILTDFWGGRPELVMQYKEGAVGASGNGSGKMKDKIKSEILKHPLVQEATKIFSGQVVDVLADNGGSETETDADPDAPMD